ncbi:hypothetical protein HKD37_04G009454 [Glycine soja]
MHSSYPESADLDEFGDEVAADVEGDEGFEAADACAADEGGGGGGVGEGEGGDLVVVQFDDGGVDADGGEELLHDVAHAAGGSGEDDDGVLRYQPLDSALGGLVQLHR